MNSESMELEKQEAMEMNTEKRVQGENGTLKEKKSSGK